MEHKAIQNIVLVGSGKLAQSVGNALLQAGLSIVQVYSPTLAHAQQLATALKTEATDKVNGINTNADLYLVAVKDEAIAEVAKTLPIGKNSIVAHTSGSTSVNVFSGHANCYGVFYPLQTFSSERIVSLQEVPVFIEGSSPEVTAQLMQLAQRISNSVSELDSESRMKLHVAAVFACNFVNHLLALSDKLLQGAGLDLALLHPLVKETVNKALSVKHPVDVQTGPAGRNDLTTIRKHIELLAAYPDLQNVYQLLTESIIGYSKQNEQL